MSIIQSFNAQNPGYDVVFADESGWVKARRFGETYIFERIGKQFILRGVAWDPNVSNNYQYWADSNRQYVAGPYIVAHVEKQINFF